MSRLRLAPIVEGHGEVLSMRILVQRIWHEMLDGQHVEVLKPIRQPRSKLLQREGLARAVDLAARKLGNQPSSAVHPLILILLDANDEVACALGPRLLAWARESRPDMDVACVIASKEYETWFVAATESLTEYLRIAENETIPERPEEGQQGKRWVRDHCQGYTETVDQPRLTAKMDLWLARGRAPSFDKLCRELESRRACNGASNPDD